MTDTKLVSDHYTHGGLLEAIRSTLEGLGISQEAVTVEDLAPLEEFHIGGRTASEGFLDQLRLCADDHVLDAGCGLGGTGRFVAHRYGSRITGIDLTDEYIQTGRALCDWVGLGRRVTLDQGSATATPYPSATFDKAYLMHVGMNIADKRLLMSELYRVLKPGALLGIYDVMRIGAGELSFPVPWASTAATSAVGTPDDYKTALRSAGFEIVAERNRREFALQSFARLQAVPGAAQAPPPLGTHILMGDTAAVKVRNVAENLAAGRVAPIELIARKES